MPENKCAYFNYNKSRGNSPDLQLFICASVRFKYIYSKTTKCCCKKNYKHNLFDACYVKYELTLRARITLIMIWIICYNQRIFEGFLLHYNYYQILHKYPISPTKDRISSEAIFRTKYLWFEPRPKTVEFLPRLVTYLLFFLGISE